MGVLSVGSGGGLFSIKKDAYGKSKALTAYVCRSDRRLICRINGITQLSAKAKFNDLNEISFEVQRYIINSSTFALEENIAFPYLHAMFSIYIPELGKLGYFRISEEPKITVESTKHEYINFTALSYETVLQGEYVKNFIINEGTAGSIEMSSYNLDAIGSPIKKIALYDTANPNYSLLNLVLQDDKYGWKIGHVDSTIASLQRSFSVDSEDIYAFLRSDVSKAFRCIFVFDTENLLINVYDITTAGSNTNIYMSLSHFIQEMNIEPRLWDIHGIQRCGQR